MASFSISAQINLVPNGDFTKWTNNIPDNWTIENTVVQSGSSEKPGPNAQLYIPNQVDIPKMTTQVALKAGVTYTVKFMYKYKDANFSGDHPISLKISAAGAASSISSSTFAINNDWTAKETTFTADQDLNYDLSFSLFSFDAQQFNVLIDDVEVYIQGTEQYTKIPDVNFENKLISLGIDSGVADGQILTSKVNKITSLDLSDSKITDLTGIQDFTELTLLNVYWNKLTSLDVSKNTKLQYLNTGYNAGIKSLDLSKNTALLNLQCFISGLTSLDLSNNTALTNLNFGSNDLTTIDLSKLKNLVSVNASNNLLTTFDTSNNLELTGIDFSRNKLTTFDSTKNIKLISLNCESNLLTSIDISKNTTLETLECGYNKFVSLDFSKSTTLNKLTCEGNAYLKDLNLKNSNNSNIPAANLKLKNNLSLSCVLVDSETYANTNWISSKDTPVVFSETACAAPKYTLIPDANFEKSLIIKGIDGVEDGKVLTNRISTVTVLNLGDYYTNLKISDLTGLEDFTALEELYLPVNGNSTPKTVDVSNNLKLKKLSVSNSTLTNLDISKNVDLEYLNCSSNKLTKLDISNNLKLNYLDCSSNSLTSLDVTKQPNLTRLEYSNNSLPNLNISNNVALTFLNLSNTQTTTLDVSKHPSLKILLCYNNKLTTVDVSKNTSLTNLDCGNNSLSTLDLSNNGELIYLVSRSNKITSLDVSKNTKLETIYCGQNSFETLDLSKNSLLKSVECSNSEFLRELNLKNGANTLIPATSLNLKNNSILNCILVDNADYANQNWSNSKDLTSSFTETVCAAPKYTLIPDPNFEKILIDKGIDKDGENGKVLTGSIASLTEFSIYKPDATTLDLTGIQDFAALKDLTISYTPVTTLDVSKNLNLNTLRCYYNKITSLDVSNNTKLITLDARNNEVLSTLDISKNTALEYVNVAFNNFTEFNVSNNPALKSIYVNNNLITSLDVSKNLALVELEVGSNKITSLDVSSNLALKELSAYGNKIPSINVSKNIALTTLLVNSNEVLTTLDISQNIALTYLNARRCQLTTIDVSKNKALGGLDISENKIESIDLSNNKALYSLNVSNNKIASIDVSQAPLLTNLLVNSNQLTNLNLKNGQNTLLNNSYVAFGANPNLYCILVDDVAYANTNWLYKKDAIATFNTECTGELSLPANNFAIETKGESCLGENNGEISIVGKASFAYNAMINDKSYTFTNNALKVSELTPGVYKINITIPEMIFEQNFNVTIQKGATVTGKSDVSSKSINVEITEGTAPFTVFVDGSEQFQTTDSNFTVSLNKAGLVEVATAKACEGVFAKKVTSYELGTMLSAYPNPTSGSIEIEIPSSKTEVVIDLYNFGGQLVSQGTYNIESGRALLNLEKLPSGIYAAKINLETPEYIKIIKN